jgi:integration host factor subunit beta
MLRFSCRGRYGAGDVAGTRLWVFGAAVVVAVVTADVYEVAWQDGLTLTPCSADGGDAVTKKQIVKDLSQRYGVDQAVTRKIVQGVLDAVVGSLADEGRIELRNFGVFEIRRRASRVARNPRTNEPIRLPPRTVVVFQPGKKLQDLTEGSETQGQQPQQQPQQQPHEQNQMHV